jgi:sugar/nucleoside kinase (ribokinase family)
MLLVFDPGPLVAEIPAMRMVPVVRRADLVSLNVQEAAVLGGAEALLGRLRPTAAVVQRAGAEGATILRVGVAPIAVPATSSRVVDSTGAGDVHVGAMLAGLAHGLGLPEATLLANRAAAYAVAHRGPATGPTEQQLKGFRAGRW